MLIDAADIILKQLKLTAPAAYPVGDGSETGLTPVRIIPAVDDPQMRVDLAGEWAVRRWPFAPSEAKLVSPKSSTARWERVAQPGSVFRYDPDQNASDVPGYDRVKLTHIDPEDGAILRRDAVIPRRWAKRRIYLRFEGIYPAARVYLNGALLGEHMSGLTPVEFDVTGKVRPGETAHVAVRLLRKHRFVQLDMPRHAMEFAGLSQGACFHATGLVQISDYHLISGLDAGQSSGTVEGGVALRNGSSRPASCRLAVVLADPAGRRVARASARLTVRPGAAELVPVALSVKEPALWNDEFPNLYTVTLRLEAGGEAQEVRYRTGFRRLELSPAGCRLNGHFVKFRGVNHLTFHPDSGMYTPEAWLRRNLALMKKANVNAIRTHFLGPACLAGLCDEMGIYLLQELPIDWGTNYIHDPAWVGPILARLEGGVRRDRHHPSVMVWAIGNENMPESNAVADAGWHHLRTFESFVKQLDPSRHTMLPPPGPANKVEAIIELRVGDIADTHYSFKLVPKLHAEGKASNPRAWDGTMEETTRDAALKRGWSGTWFSSEYGIFNLHPDLLNAPYNSIISDLQEDILSGKSSLQVFADRMRYEWDLMRDDPTCLGGAYFPWLCAGAGRGPEGNPWGWVRWGESADWGVVTADLLPKPFFWAMRVAFSPVWLSPDRAAWKRGETALRVRVTNHYNAIDLRDCTLRTLMGGGGRWMGMSSEYRDVPVQCAPGESKEIEIPIWNKGTLGSLEGGSPVCCRCVFLDPRGYRPLMQDIIVVPEAVTKLEAAMPMGPDAVEQ